MERTVRPSQARLAAALGVTRVARVSGLDRTGVEVACAIRPGGHVLQVTNGKGLSLRAAELGALSEAAELACAERVPPASLCWGTPAELRGRGPAILGPEELGGERALHLPIAWCKGTELGDGQAVLVPAAAVHVPVSGSAPLGVSDLRWTSNGMGAHPSRPAALAHALLELVERHELALALPEGWTEDAVRCFRLSPAAAERTAPRAARLGRRLGRRGFEVHLFALPRHVGLPTAAALLFDSEHSAVPLTAGYACRPDQDGAVLAALLEAAQSRLTDIHGAREDVGPAEGRGVGRLRRACRVGRPDRDHDHDHDHDRDP
ncbi:MAG TPA: YcaO-like family protein, partial [Anaeromyxobacteraceae bacterium]